MVLGPVASANTLQAHSSHREDALPHQKTAQTVNEALRFFLASQAIINAEVLKKASSQYPNATRIVLEPSSGTRLELPGDLLSRLADLFPKIQEIALKNYSNPYFVFNLSDADFQASLPKLSKLRVIELHQCRSLTGESFTALFHACRQLEKATIVSDQLTDDNLQAALGNKALKSLHLSGAAALSDKALATLSSEGEHLEELSLDMFQNPFTLTAAKTFAAALPQLQRLSFSGCGAVDDEFVQKLREHHPDLQKLWLDPSPNISEGTFITIQDIPELKLGEEKF